MAFPKTVRHIVDDKGTGLSIRVGSSLVGCYSLAVKSNLALWMNVRFVTTHETQAHKGVTSRIHSSNIPEKGEV